MTNCKNFVATARKSWGTFIVRSLMLLLTVLGVPDGFAQSESIPVSFTLEAPQPSCGVTKLKDINFGVLGRPAPGRNYGNGENSYGYATLDERYEGGRLFTRFGVTKEGGTPTVGKLKITASHANTLTLTWVFPRKLVMGDREIRYLSIFYSHSRNEDGPWDRMGTHHIRTLSDDGVEPARPHYFQIGGMLVVWYNTEPGPYTATMTLSVSCPE